MTEIEPSEERLPQLVDWQSIQDHLPDIRSVDGGFSSALRGLVTLDDGRELFVKVGQQENTKRWAKKEIAVYRILARHDFPYSPRLIAASDDESGFALEPLTAESGWNWQEQWSIERLDATLKAMSELAALPLKEEERQYLSEETINQSDNGWVPLRDSPDKQALLRQKLDAHPDGSSIADTLNFAEDAARSERYVFATDTFVHYDLRADNCAWNPEQQRVQIVDWNWCQLGDARIELAATLTHIQKSGFDIPNELIKKLDPDALHWMAGLWFNAAATPIWDGGPAHLRDLQLLAGITALQLARSV